MSIILKMRLIYKMMDTGQNNIRQVSNLHDNFCTLLWLIFDAQN